MYNRILHAGNLQDSELSTFFQYSFSSAIIGVSFLLFFIHGLWIGAPSASSIRVDKVVVIKSKRILTLMSQREIVKTYKISLGPNPKGHKTRQGDGKTPEGNYFLDWRNSRSKFHLSIHISYPNQADLSTAQQLGVSVGGDIMIHGLPYGLGWIGRLHRFWNWTDGCIAVTNPEVEEIWRAVPDGTPIEIKP